VRARLATWRPPLGAAAWGTRALSGLAAVGAGSVLFLAAILTPSTSGLGTHTQLGLADCTFLGWTGMPCPMCGATTTFALLAHFRVIDGVLNQPFAALLFALTCGMLAVAIAEVADPRGRWGRMLGWFERYEVAAGVGFLALMAASWIYKLAIVGFRA
jgi:hypothetical protein